MSGTVSGRVLKAMGLFGGVRMLQILFGVVRVKLLALWLGPAGVGLFGIFNNAVETVRTLAQLGLSSSSVREIASQPTASHRALIIAVVRRWAWILGLFGAVLMAAGAPVLSRWTFGSSDHTLAYMGLASVIFLLSVNSAGEAVLQGLGELRRLAKASVWGAGVGLILSVPMYYFWGLSSVVPSIIAYAGATCFFTLYFGPRGVRVKHQVSASETLSLGKRFIILGIYMTAADFIAQAMSYVFVAWLNVRGGDSEVGFYQAGYTVVNRYVGLIFAAIATEYYPRLARVAGSAMRLRVFVAHEMRLLLLLLFPAVLFLIALAPCIVNILYDSRFSSAVPFITIAMAGVVLRGVSYCMSYVILAKGDGHTFLMTESLSAVAGLALNIVCYRWWGIAGLGVSYTLWYLLYVIIIAWVYCIRYRQALPHRLVLFAALTLCLTVGAIIVASIISPLFLLIPAVISGLLSLRSLRRLLMNKRK